MQSNGGITTAAKCAARSPSRRCSPARSVERSAAPRWRARPAGPTCSAWTWAERPSTSASSSTGGRPSRTETELEGLPVLMPLVDIHTIGAGGGSLAWLEAGGLRVGPQSAGADPGPRLLRPRRDRADRHRREPPARPARPRVLPRRAHAARRRPPPARAASARRARSGSTRRARRGDARDHQRQDGRRHADDHGEAGDRPARVLARRLRWRRADARGLAGRGARDRAR